MNDGVDLHLPQHEIERRKSRRSDNGNRLVDEIGIGEHPLKDAGNCMRGCTRLLECDDETPLLSASTVMTK